MRSLLLLLALPSLALAAGPDGVVENDAASHLPHQDLRPRCPVDGEEFTVLFHVLAGDITAARVRVDDGASVQWIDAGPVDQRGIYDVWGALIPATSTATQLSYVVELTDGSDQGYLGPDGWSTTLPSVGFGVDFLDLSHAPYGATPVTGGAVFRVWAPTRASAYVRGDFNGWSLAHPMTKVGDSWVARVNGATPRQMYKFFFNNSVWNSDPRGRGLNQGNNTNAYLEDPEGYVWASTPMVTPPIEELVIYQLHVGTFAGRNDPLGSTQFPSRYLDVAARVDHLAELGVNAIQLNPITEFSGDISAGYNPITQYAPEWKYGPPDDFKALVDACHTRGIAVLLDIVWNHFSVNDNFLWFYDGSQIYFDSPAVDTPWGAQADFDDPQVRDYFLDSLGLWLDEYRLDGFRMDATGAMDLPEQAAAGYSLMQELNDAVDRRWRDKVVIAEELPDDSFITRPTLQGGAGFDSQYHDAFTDQLRSEIQDAAFGSAEMWRIANIVNGSGSFLSGRHVSNYFELHDEAWPQNGGQRMVVTIDPTAPHDDAFAQGRHKLAHGLVLTAPGVPLLLQGAEWLESTPWGPDSDKRLDWSNKTTYSHIFRYFQDLIGLRVGNPALHASSSRNVHHLDEGLDVLGFVRTDNAGNTVVVVTNFANVDRLGRRVGLPEAGTWEGALSSQDPAYGGPGPALDAFYVADPVAADGYPQSVQLDLPAMGLVLLRWAGMGTPAPETTDAPVSRLRWRSANPSAGTGEVRLELATPGLVRLDLIDVRGRRMAMILEEWMAAGVHQRTLDARDLPSGVYFLRMRQHGTTSTRRVLLLK